LKNKNLKEVFSVVRDSKIIAFDFEKEGNLLRINTADYKFAVYDL
jgi:hypothetical protein